MKKLILLCAITLIAFAGCKKEECPAPTPAPVQKKMMVYIKNAALTDITVILSRQSDGAEWMGYITNYYASAPSCGAQGAFTIDVSSGEVYSIYASDVTGTQTWGPTNYTVSSDCTAIPIL